MINNEQLQNNLLAKLQRAQIPVSVYVLNRIKLQGIIEGFDECTILLKNPAGQLVYKQAITAIVPATWPEIS